MRWVVLTLAVFALMAAPARAQQTTSLDSEAPPGSPPHWLPNETWVMQHWLPYDETRLYSLMNVTRGDIWRWLRDDTRNLAGLAALHGWKAEDLARELVAPWHGKLRDPARLALLESRALRTLTQGHLSQHIFFHSLHQEAIPSAAPEIFGTSTTRFRFLRRSELSPLMICRLNGKSRAHAQEAAEQTLRAMAARGVRGQAIPAAQAQRLLARQLRRSRAGCSRRATTGRRRSSSRAARSRPRPTTPTTQRSPPTASTSPTKPMRPSWRWPRRAGRSGSSRATGVARRCRC